MLKSYEAIVDQGKIEWLSGPPPGERLRVVVVVDQPNRIPLAQPKKRRQPPLELKNSVRWHSDPLEPVISEEEWEASLERTARQIAGDPEAFK
ncbi:MAG: hypothetical protein HQL94_06075 [Magnetococcales bacterium]|nr:hypothetical protein [Magnetococcales bacterium]MBF0438406.1 hypothetical protein [Magnetococcales bacterium]